jgi:hypothetical protein
MLGKWGDLGKKKNFFELGQYLQLDCATPFALPKGTNH